MDLFHASRRANVVSDTLTIILFLFVTAIGAVIANQFFDSINTDLQADPNLSNLSKNITNNYNNIQPSLWDKAILMACVLLTIGFIISVFLLDTHPIFFFINFVLLLGVFSAVLILGNAFDDLMTDATLSTYALDFPFTTWIFDHVVQLAIAIGMFGLIALFAKLRNT